MNAAPLTMDEAAGARALHGENRLTRRKPRGFFPRLLESFGDPIIRILLIALGVNALFLFRDADWYETVGILAAILVATVVSTLSEMGGEAAFRRLQAEAARSRCRVVRREGTLDLPVDEIAVGDLVILRSGDSIPADGLLVEGELSVDQSPLNGETREARKAASANRSQDLLAPSSLFSGTTVRGGEGVMRVSAVGDGTFYGGLAREVQAEKGDSPLKRRLTDFAKSVSVIGYVGAALVAAAFLVNAVAIDNEWSAPRIMLYLSSPARVGQLLSQAAGLAVSVVVMAVPEGLPMMITVVLSANMRRMRRANVLVRKLVGIETAGSLNVLFTDKTGTLTRGKPRVTAFISGSGDDLRAAHNAKLWQTARRAALLNNGASVSKGRAVGGNGTDRALLEFALRGPVDVSGCRKGAVVPFDSARKYRAVSVTGVVSGTFVTGAPEAVLPRCVARYTEDGSTAPISRSRLSAAMDARQGEAARLVALAFGEWAEGEATPPLTLIGIAVIQDEARPEAASGVAKLQGAGIQVVMITGDAKRTAEAIARQTGILRGGGLSLTSAELSALTDDELAETLPRLAVVSRALPADKSRLVRVARANGLVTGMTGDGVNDCPALKQADVGFAMGSGAEAAKEAGDVVIVDDNLLSIANAVRYGRTTFKSIRKFIVFQMTLNLCAMGVSVIAPLLGVDAPVTIVQMLWLNMVMDTLAGLAFGGEQALARYMAEPPKRLDEPILNRYMTLEILLGAGYMLALCLFFLKSPITRAYFPGGSPLPFQTAFFGLFMFSGIFGTACARTHKLNLLDHMAGNKTFLLIMGLITAAQTAILYFGGAAFRVTGLTPRQFALIIALSATTLAAHLLRKLCYRAFRVTRGT